LDIALQPQEEPEGCRVGRVQSEAVRLVEIEASVAVMRELGVIEVRADTGGGLAVILVDEPIVVAPQRGINIGRLEPQLLAEGLAARDLDAAIETAGRSRRRRALLAFVELAVQPVAGRQIA